jgi:hypothetical protein
MHRFPHRFVQHWVNGFFLWSFVCFSASITANAQFKELGPPPYSPTVARQKIRTLLEKVDPDNLKQTVDTLSGLLGWYRDTIDEELIAAWKRDARANLPAVMESLASSRVASGVVEFSWRERSQGALNPAYAPMFVNLMTRFPESARPLLDDLQGATTLDLSRSEAETVCRILLDMPDVGTWRKSALQVLPHYRRVAESLLVQDLNGSDREKSYRARVWLADLKVDVAGNPSEQPSQRRRPAATRAGVSDSVQRPAVNDSIPLPPVNDSIPAGDQTASLARPRSVADRPSAPTAPSSAPPARPPLTAAQAPSAPQPYNGPKSGTLEYSGNPVPQNAEYVFRNVPLVKMQLDYDTKIWDARLAPSDGQTQKLIVRNKSSGPQKRCVVRWSVIP